MTYSHSWYRVETPAGPLPPEPRHAYGRLAFDTLAIIDRAAEVGIMLANGAAAPASRPTVDEGGIWLNGAKPNDAESFAWPAAVGPEAWWSDRVGDRWWDACATERRPYDSAVCAILIRAAAHYGRSIRIGSDGSWTGQTRDGTFWPEWKTARRLVVDLFGADADSNPLAR